MTRLNVRCCCQPTKILGTLEVPDMAIRSGHFDVVLCTRFVPLSSVSNRYDFQTKFRRETVHLKTFGNSRVAEQAIYSDDRPIEFWRKIHGFREGDAIGQVTA